MTPSVAVHRVPSAAERAPSRVAGVEVGLFSLGMLALLWEVWNLVPGVPDARVAVRVGAALLLLGSLVGSFVRCGVRPVDVGLSARGLRSGWSGVVGFTAAAVAGLVVLGLVWGEPSVALLRRSWLFHYIIGVVGQQLALQAFFNNRLYELARASRRLNDGRGFAVLGSSTLFAAFHAPNLWLVVVTFCAGTFWSWHFRRHANLPALVLSQLVLGATAMLMLGDGPLLHLRVGWGAMKLLLGVE